jgi:hydrogenase maturation protease
MSVPPSSGLLVLGLGNDLMADDAVGLHVVRAIAARLPEDGPVTVRESPQMGFSLMDDLAGYEVALLVDAVQTGQAPPGHVHVLDPAALKTLPVTSPHFAGVGEMIALGRRLDLSMPREVRVLAIEAADPYTFSTRMSDVLQASLGTIVETVWAEVCRARDSLHPRGAPAHA